MATKVRGFVSSFSAHSERPTPTNREAAAFNSPVRERGVWVLIIECERRRCATGAAPVPALSGLNYFSQTSHALTNVAIEFRPFGPDSFPVQEIRHLPV